MRVQTKKPKKEAWEMLLLDLTPRRTRGEAASRVTSTPQLLYHPK